MSSRASQALSLVKETWKEFKADNASRIGAALAYYTTFSLAPILVIAMGLVGILFGPDAAQQHVSREISGMIGPVGAEAVEDMLANAHRAGGGVLATVIGAITLVLGASTVFLELQGALNLMWDAPPSKVKGILGTLRARGLSFSMVLVIGFLLLVSLLLSATISGVGDQLGAWVELPGFVLQFLNQAISLTVTTGLFTLLYKVLPDVKIAWSDVWVGGLFTAILFTVGKAIIGLYLGHSSIASAYGAAGSFAVTLVWIYYSAQLVLFGAEFTQVYARHHGSRTGQPAAPIATASPGPPPVPPLPAGARAH